MLMRRRRWLRHNNSVFEDVTSCRHIAPSAHTRAHARSALFVDYLFDRSPYGVFLRFQPSVPPSPFSLSLSLSLSLYLLLCVLPYTTRPADRCTGVTYRWPINAPAWTHDTPACTCGPSSLRSASFGRATAWQGIFRSRSFPASRRERERFTLFVGWEGGREGGREGGSAVSHKLRQVQSAGAALSINFRATP